MKNFFISIIILSFILAATFAFASNTNEKNETSEIMVYSVDQNIFEDFIQNPSWNILKNNHIRSSTYKKSLIKDDYIENQLYINGSVQINESKSGIMRIGSLPVYTEFLDYISSINNIKQYLIENHIICDINSYVLIECSAPQIANIPITM